MKLEQTYKIEGMKVELVGQRDNLQIFRDPNQGGRSEIFYFCLDNKVVFSQNIESETELEVFWEEIL